MLHALFMFITSTMLPEVVTEIGGITYYAWATTFLRLARSWGR
jgi:hypothetical protein